MAQRSLHAVTKVYYGHMPGLAKVVQSTIALLRFPRVVVVPRPLLQRVSLGKKLHQIPTHPSQAQFPQHSKLLSKSFHTGHVVAHVVLG
jgi:hypothetical protein